MDSSHLWEEDYNSLILMGKPLADHLAPSHWLGVPSKAQMGERHDSKYVSNPAIKINTQGSSSQLSFFFLPVWSLLERRGRLYSIHIQFIIRHFVLIPRGTFFLSEWKFQRSTSVSVQKLLFKLAKPNHCLWNYWRHTGRHIKHCDK